MSKVLRALLISGVATGVAAVAVQAVRKSLALPPAPAEGEKGVPYVEAERLPDEQRDQLMDELASQL